MWRSESGARSAPRTGLRMVERAEKTDVRAIPTDGTFVAGAVGYPLLQRR